jgi:hypothetical protein
MSGIVEVSLNGLSQSGFAAIEMAGDKLDSHRFEEVDSDPRDAEANANE